MKLANLIDVLDSMINVNTDTELIIDNFSKGSVLWQGRAVMFGEKMWLVREFKSWRYIADTNTVIVYMWNG